MTLNDIISSALEQAGRSTDAQTVSTWRRKFTALANEGLMDLGDAIKLRRTDTLTVANGEIDLTLRPYAVSKVLSIRQGSSELDVARGSATSKLKVAATGSVTVEYRYYPHEMSSDTDVPEIPEPLHHLIPIYVCEREYSGGNVDTQNRWNAPYSLYREGRAQAKRNYGEAESYKITNKGSW